MLTNLVTLDISLRSIIDAYVEIDLASRRHSAGAVNMGKNDVWIAAAAKAAGAVLLTTDKDFDHLHPALIRREYVAPSSSLPTP
jgi:predicted nucleic acid-binding protein